ncbi:MAG: imidazole glycerol phosphate synthase HisHF, partial [Planctomycetota bacterium]
DAERLVLPGVGTFGAAMEAVDADALRRRNERDAPTRAVSVGIQIKARGSEESPRVPGHGVLPCEVTRFPRDVRVPQMGWNRVAYAFAYFANSFRFTEAPAGWEAQWSDHGGPFVASLRRGRVWGCQFHPELSGRYGARLLEEWLAC